MYSSISIVCYLTNYQGSEVFVMVFVQVHPGEEVHFAHSAHFPRVVQEANVPVRGTVELFNVFHTKPALKFLPDVSAKSVSDGHSHRVLPVCLSLGKQTCLLHKCAFATVEKKSFDQRPHQHCRNRSLSFLIKRLNFFVTSYIIKTLLRGFTVTTLWMGSSRRRSV